VYSTESDPIGTFIAYAVVCIRKKESGPSGRSFGRTPACLEHADTGLLERKPMSTYESAKVESTDVEPRTERALTECMTVLPEGGDIYTVVGENQNGEYRVDARKGRCTCADHKHRDARCKHLRRVAFATGDVPVPTGVDDVDPQLGTHTDAQPFGEREEPVVATDGGIIDAGDDAEILDESDARPEDCDCGDWNADADLPCWPCYRDGFEEPASAE
jgi:hypothetical protein